ncbi:PilN domain-containing protein [Stieleria sp. JC731]|uniref:PilN domain-containing protein n=1 Tax=Pirellulaceae TaxID=2691357 RepID=UPI001E37373D|nr:PilN domain-containing protein [Stieleria sp. JC731]MCC9601566.1 PilN domain-containing protein [Stieleria sp. JC731]
MNQSSKDLLTAIGEEPSPLERRSRSDLSQANKSSRRVRFDRRRKARLSIGLEISPSGVSLAFTEAVNDKKRLIVDRVEFPADRGPAKGDWNDGTLQSCLVELVQRHGLSGQAVHCSVGGKPCVTRILAGPDQQVDNELAELAGRTERYIGMGVGEKVRSEFTYRIDAKRKRVWVTVAMRDVVEAVAKATRATGLRLANLEHTMLVLSRVLHNHGRDAQEPVLMGIDDLGRIDLGISYQGRLLLDYRPAMPDEDIDQADVIQRHLKCLRRYVQAQFPDASSNLDKIYVASPSDHAVSADKSTGDKQERNFELAEYAFPFAELCDGYEIAGDCDPSTSLIAAIGLVRDQQSSHAVVDANNLVTTLQMQQKLPLRKLMKATWPITTIAVATIILVIMEFQVAGRIHEAEAKIDSHLSEVDHRDQLRADLTSRIEFDKEIQQVKQSIKRPQWADIIWDVGHELPERMWLESIQFHNDQTLLIVGVSRSDHGVFDYLERLRNSKLLTRVSLQSTSSHRGASTTDVRFEISAQISQPEAPAKLAESDALEDYLHG